MSFVVPGETEEGSKQGLGLRSSKKMFRLDPVAAFEELFMKSPAAKQYADDLAQGNNTSISTPISASPSPLVLHNTTNTSSMSTVHGRVFQRLKQLVANINQPRQNTDQESASEDENAEFCTPKASKRPQKEKVLTLAPTASKKLMSTPLENGPSPSVFLTPQLVASKQVPKVYDIVTGPNKKLLRNGKSLNENIEIAAVVKEEPIETPDELPAIEVQAEATRKELVGRNSEINTEHPPELNFPTDEDSLPEQNISEDFCEKRDKRKSGFVPRESSKELNLRRRRAKQNVREQSHTRQKTTWMNEWTIVPWGVTDPGICVEGHRRVDEPGKFWKSSKIVNRISDRLVETVSGQRYRLVGYIAEEEALNHGFDDNMVAAFRKGFPVIWEELIEDYLKHRKRRKSQESASPEKKPDIDSMNQSFNSRQKKVVVRKSRRKSIPKSFFDDTPKSKKQSTRTSQRKMENTKGNSTKSKKEQKDPISISDLPRTRSGRTVKPPVQTWAGQRYVYGSMTDTIDIERPDLSLTPAGDVSLGDTPAVTFKIDPRVRMREKRAKQEALNNSLSKRRRKNTSKADTSASIDSRDTTMDTEDTDSEIRVNLGGSPTSYKSHNNPGAESSAEKRYAETLARSLQNSEGTPLTSVGGSSSNKLRIRKSLELEMDPEEDLFSSDDGEAISKVKRRNRNVILSSEESENEGVRVKKQSTNSLLKKALENSSSAALKEQSVDILEVLNSPFADRKKLPSTLSQKIDKNSFVLPDKAKKQEETEVNRRLSRSPYVLLTNLKIKPLQPVAPDSDSTDSDCLITDFSPVLKRITRQSSQRKVVSKEKVTEPVKRTRGRAQRQNSRKLPTISEEAENQQRLGRISQEESDETETIAGAKSNRQTQARKRAVESDLLENEPEAKKKPRTKTKGTTNKRSAGRKRIPRKEEREKEPTVAEVLKEISKPAETNSKNKTSKNTENRNEHQRNTCTDQSDDENNEPPWTDSEIRNLKRALNKVERDTPQYWEVIANEIGTRDALQCQRFHQGEAPSTVKKKPKAKKQKVAVTKPADVTGGKKTMKRRQQIRELIEHHDVADEEEMDFFNATPGRTNKNKIGSLLEDSFCQGLSSMQTPALLKTLTPGSRMSRLLMSGKKTPASHLHIVTPKVSDVNERNNEDNYIHRMINRKPTRVREAHKSQDRMDAGSSNVQVTSDMFETQHVSQDDMDSEEEEDYYFSDAD